GIQEVGGSIPPGSTIHLSDNRVHHSSIQLAGNRDPCRKGSTAPQSRRFPARSKAWMHAWRAPVLGLGFEDRSWFFSLLRIRCHRQARLF
ncbi:MAG: hypothetical protein WCJ41_02730, partial [Aestuariivirga sp.]|uniref:hypothetical protein n=1 Tax=Aestuariivirga sp. TaxID=2650926 RepID=UPI0030163719